MSFSRVSTPSHRQPVAGYHTPGTSSSSALRIKSTLKPTTTTNTSSISKTCTGPKSAYKELDRYIQRYEESGLVSHTDASLADIKLIPHNSRLSRSVTKQTPSRSVTRSKSPIYSHQPPPMRMEQPHHPLNSSSDGPLKSLSRESFHMHQHEYAQKSSQFNITESITPYRGDSMPLESIENSVQHFLTSLEKHRKHRTHQLRQIQQFLSADLDWENEFGESMIQANVKKNELTDEEFQAYLLGELPGEVPTSRIAEKDELHSAAHIALETSTSSKLNNSLQNIDLDEAMDLSISRNDKKTHLRLLTRNIGDLLQQMSESQSAATLQPVISDYAKESIQSISQFHRQNQPFSMEKESRQTPIKVSWDEYNIAQSSKKENLPLNRVSITSSATVASISKQWTDIPVDEPLSSRPPQPPSNKEETEMQPLISKITPVKDLGKQRYASSDSDSEESGYSHRNKSTSHDPMKKYLKQASKESREWLASNPDLRQISKIDRVSEEEEFDIFSIAKGGLELAYDIDFTLGSKTPEPKTPKAYPKFT